MEDHTEEKKGVSTGSQPLDLWVKPASASAVLTSLKGFSKHRLAQSKGASQIAQELDKTSLFYDIQFRDSLLKGECLMTRTCSSTMGNGRKGKEKEKKTWKRSWSSQMPKQSCAGVNMRNDEPTRTRPNCTGRTVRFSRVQGGRSWWKRTALWVQTNNCSLIRKWFIASQCCDPLTQFITLWWPALNTALCCCYFITVTSLLLWIVM